MCDLGCMCFEYNSRRLSAAEFRSIADLQDKNYAFLEFRSVEEASNCMAFDGVVFNNTYLRVGLWLCD